MVYTFKFFANLWYFHMVICILEYLVSKWIITSYRTKKLYQNLYRVRSEMKFQYLRSGDILHDKLSMQASCWILHDNLLQYLGQLVEQGKANLSSWRFVDRENQLNFQKNLIWNRLLNKYSLISKLLNTLLVTAKSMFDR